ncbi:hypothetical protein DPMN_070791 [Dreissena polymorpha]|uniref:Uncharacterized protein n=1 Tax=Dreissena polymorpha TaxID=45954 RepID=A0A9D4BVX6_DREPO|nr:hypothetical protein DPMN_070791 [Dreissena polymorpha]
MEGWRKNGIQGPPALYWTQRYNGPHYIGVTVYCENTELKRGIEPTTSRVVVRHFNRVTKELAHSKAIGSDLKSLQRLA